MSTAERRKALSRAEFFLDLAEQCPIDKRDDFEAFLEASIVFARSALHRLKSKYEKHPGWNSWFSQLRGTPSVEFFREHRDFLLKEASVKVGQLATFNPVTRATQLYFFEDPSIAATQTVRMHLTSYAQLLADGEASFGS
jgi:hypothetical protein